MAEPIKVPAVGETITEGVLARWLKKHGDSVRRGEPLFTLETDKATQDVPAPADGVVSVAVAEGATVKIDSVVGQIETGKVAVEKKSAEPVLMPAARQLAADAGVEAAKVQGTGRDGRILKEDVVNYLEQQKPASARRASG